MRTLDLGTQHVGNHPYPVELPLDFVTESSAILAKKGAGKTNALVVLLEEVAAAGVPVVSVDPKGDHWGLKAGSEGHPGAGLPIVVFGGLHHDVPLEPTGGALVADLIRDRGLSAVLDVSEFTIGERARFLTAFADRLYRFDSHEPMLLGLEEAHEYIPQMVRGEEARMVGAFERLVKLGRSKGLGVVMVTQRSASLNKNVLTQVDNLFVMRTTSPQDRAAVTAWLDTNADRSVLDNLGGLQTGEAVLVHPARGEPLRFRFRMRRTFDAGETPKVGERRREPATIADVDLEAIAAAMADTIERSKADDPKVLRATIADLQKQLAARPVEEVVREVEKVVEVPLLSDDDRLVLAEIDGMLRGLAAVLPLHTGILEKIAPTTPSPRSESKPVRARELVPHESAPTTPRPAPTAGEARGSDSDRARLGKAERAILAGLATHGGMPHKRLALIAGYSPSSSGFKNPLATLRRLEYAIGGGDHIQITPAGVAALGDFEALPTGEALIDYWMEHPQSGKAERAILGALIDAWPSPLTHNELAARAGYEPTSSGFKNPLAKLRRLELAHGGGTAIYASDELGEARHRRKAS
jgi:hypothetical protein